MPARARRSRLGTQAKIVSSRLAGGTAALNNFRLRRGGGLGRKAGSPNSPKRGEQLSPAEKERQARLLKHLLDVLGHLAGQQLGTEQGLARQRLDQFGPVGLRQQLDADAHVIRSGPGALHSYAW